jgi:hypothetical protein
VSWTALHRWTSAAWLLVLAAPLSAADWADERRLGAYVFHSEFPLRDVAELVDELGELQKDIESTLELQCSAQPIHIHLFRTRYSYMQHVKQIVPGVSNRQALFVAGNEGGNVYAYRHQNLATDLRHETTHALLHNALPYVPLWLDEGLAEYFEVPVGLRASHNPHRRGMQMAIRFGSWRPNLADLEANRDIADMTANDYRDAWGWVHFLLHGPPEARAALEEFLLTIPTGREPTPLSVSLSRRLPDVDRRALQHLR